MSTPTATADELHRSRRPWTATFRLDRVAVCPLCATLLSSNAVHFVAGVAFCPHCATLDVWYTLRAAQFLHSAHAYRHTTTQHGLLWYTPDRPGPPTAARLAHDVDAFGVWLQYPMTPDGYTIPAPHGINAMDVLDDVKALVANGLAPDDLWEGCNDKHAPLPH